MQTPSSLLIPTNRRSATLEPRQASLFPASFWTSERSVASRYFAERCKKDERLQKSSEFPRESNALEKSQILKPPQSINEEINADPTSEDGNAEPAVPSSVASVDNRQEEDGQYGQVLNSCRKAPSANVSGNWQDTARTLIKMRPDIAPALSAIPQAAPPQGSYAFPNMYGPGSAWVYQMTQSHNVPGMVKYQTHWQQPTPYFAQQPVNESQQMAALTNQLNAVLNLQTSATRLQELKELKPLNGFENMDTLKEFFDRFEEIAAGCDLDEP